MSAGPAPAGRTPGSSDDPALLLVYGVRQYRRFVARLVREHGVALEELGDADARVSAR